MNNTSVLLYSSGLDSYFAHEYLVAHNQDFDRLYFNHGGKYCEHELKKIKNLPFVVTITNDIQLKDVEREDSFIPNRNMLFTMMANSYGYEKVWIGGTKSDRVNDNNKEVFDSVSKFLTNMNGKYFIATSPFWDVYKTDVIQWFLNRREYNILDVAKELLTYTFSCYNPENKERESNYFIKSGFEDKSYPYLTEECLNCSACFRKNVELFSIGVFIPFKNNFIIERYLTEIDFAIQLNIRMEATLRYIKELKKRDSSKK
jgi:7-cyano-7-deazaguanine synthase in queuosine biosynthesis